MIKRILSLAAIMVCVSFFFSGCKKEKKQHQSDKCTSCAVFPEAKAQFDNSSAGVYKGIITGSSGTLAFYIGNADNEIKALIAFDGKSAVLTSTSLSDWDPGDAINAAVFIGTLDGKQVQAKLTIGAGGQDPFVELTIPGHTINVAVFKETSAVLVKSFEGTYSGDEKGTLNIVMAGDEYTVLVKGQVLVRRTKLVDGKIEFISSGTAVKGEFISENLLRGEWSNTEGEKGTWQAERTL